MKKSNLIFFGLVAFLCLAPFVIYAVSSLGDDGNMLIGFSDRYKVVQIENESLTPDRVEIDTEGGYQPFEEKLTTFTCLYYKGKRSYSPEIRTDGDTLRIGQPKKAPRDASLTLHIQMKNVQKVWLNGREIWEK